MIETRYAFGQPSAKLWITQFSACVVTTYD